MLSIIIPTLNEEKYLPRLLKSIEKQNFTDYEIIVADAGSKDRTTQIAKNFGGKIVAGGLPAKGRNQGAKEARGDLLLFLDADLKVPENFLEKSLKEFEERKLDVASYTLIPQTKRKVVKTGFNLLWNRMINLSQNVLPNGAMGILIRKKFFDKVGGFEEDIKLAEDLYFVRQAAKFGRFGIIKSTKIYIILRRFEKDGYFKTLLKYILCFFYMLSGRAVRSDILNYRFNHYSKDNKN
ncbi:MAG: glycosyltransferase [Candidatus Pacebacteria bacterium]|nr:glycosyltransferase [Candidatus Paceibacterota bacterium]